MSIKDEGGMFEKAAYRHVEVLHVVECDSCSARSAEARRIADGNAHLRRKLKRLGKDLFICGPWLYGWACLVLWFFETHPDDPAHWAAESAWVHIAGVSLIFATIAVIIATPLSLRLRMRKVL